MIELGIFCTILVKLIFQLFLPISKEYENEARINRDKICRERLLLLVNLIGF